MTKQEIARHICRTTNLSPYDAQRAADAFIDACKGAIAQGDDIFLRGFGTLRIITRKAKKARLIKTGATIDLPAHRTVKFLPSPKLNIKQE